MLKRIIYLILLIFLSLTLVEGVRFAVADNLFYPVAYNAGVNSNNAKLILLSGRIKQYVRDYDEAKSIYTSVLHNDNWSQQKGIQERAYSYLGDNYYAKADYANAVKAYYLALKKNPANKDALLRFVRINMAYGNSEQILPVVKAYVNRRPKDPVGYGELCAVYYRLGQLNAARINCQLATKHQRNYARARYDLAIVLNRIGFKKEAEKEMKLAKKIRPSIKSREELEELLRSVAKN